jgi:serine/threonine protein phosphatase PrpC
MRNFVVTYHTDVGIKKKTNQDSLLIEAVGNADEEVMLALLCDGMGGMDKGELASATVIRAFDNWLKHTYTQKGAGWSTDDIKSQWTAIFHKANTALMEYGRDQNIQLGTTATALLLHSDGRYVIGHIGDTRIYGIGERHVSQMTEDHTFVAREIRRGNMTPEQAAIDSRRNVLLQCIGVNEFVEPQLLSGKSPYEGWLLCSDGFRHVLTEAELEQYICGAARASESEMKSTLIDLVELNKARLETDNISAIWIRTK